MTITYSLAFVAGLASFFSPCVFSLIPAYISYLSGTAIAGMDNKQENNKKRTVFITFTHGIAFILGFSLVFISLGAAFSSIGGILAVIKPVLAKVGGIIVILFGLHMTGLITIPFLYYDVRVHKEGSKNTGYVSSFLMGIFFSAGWAPCIGTVLSTILMLALNQGQTAEGVKLLAIYSGGLAIPFLFASLGIGWVTSVIKRYGKVMHYIEICMGIILIIVGVMLFL